MQNIFHLGLPALFVMAFASAVPTPVASYDFRHFTDDEGMTVSFSRNSPPLAALEDERLPVVKTEPAMEMKRLPNSKIIGSGNLLAWKHLQKYARSFERRHHLVTVVRHHVVPKIRSSVAVKQRASSRLIKIADLIKLLKPVNQGPRVSRPKFLPGLRLMASADERVQNDPSPSKRPTMREEVEVPLTGKSVDRNLPAGEEALPQIIPGDHISSSDEKDDAPAPMMPSAMKSHVSNTAPPIKGQWKLSRPPSAAPSTAQTKYIPPAQVSTQNIASNGRVTVPGSEHVESEAVMRPSVESTHAGAAAATAAATAPAQADGARIVGQIELTGGLAVTGQTTKLDVVWKTGEESREATIDYSTGQFAVDVPSLEVGKIIATLTDSANHVLGEAIYDLDGAAGVDQNLLEGVKLVIEPKETFVKGKVASAYSVDNIFVPVKDAEIFSPGGARVSPDAQGNFQLEGVNADSTLVMEAYAPDHWGTRVIAEGGHRSSFPLFPTKMLQSFFDLVGQSSNNTELGVIWGVVKHHGKPQAGVQVALATPNDAIGPFYFNALRIPDSNLKGTGTNGLYAFVKVKPGLQMVMAQYQGGRLPSSVVAVSASMVSYTEVAFKSAKLSGRVEDPILQKALPAQISVVGTTEVGTSTENGFQLRVPSSDPVLFLEANAGPDYYVSREAVPRSKAGSVDIYAFKKDWLSKEINAIDTHQDPAKGIFVGYVTTGPVFHVSLDSDGGREYSEQNIGYFGADGHLENGRIEGLAGGGGFVLTNVPPGLHTLVITSAEGQMTMSRLFVAEAGVLNVTTADLRP